MAENSLQNQKTFPNNLSKYFVLKIFVRYVSYCSLFPSLQFTHVWFEYHGQPCFKKLVPKFSSKTRIRKASRFTLAQI